MKSIPDVSVVLVDVRSTHNVGSVFRTADASGVEHIYCAGYTPTPVDRFGRPRSDVAKTALGAEQTVSWSQHEHALELIQELQSNGVMCIACEQHTSAQDYRAVEVKTPVAFIFGNEVDGLPEDILKEVDVVAEIPQVGGKESLNVSVAAGVMLFRLSPNLTK